MEAKKSYALIVLGLCVRSPFNSFPSDPARIPKKHIRMLREGLSSAGFDVSLAGLQELDGIATKLHQLHDEDEIGADLAAQLAGFMQAFEKILHAESSTKRIYVIPKRRFNSEFLLDSPQNLLKTGAYARLSPIAQSDLTSGCRCLAFGEGTAAAFHILRATEDTLKKYHLHKVKRRRLAKPMWGNMISALRQLKRNKPAAPLLDSLDLVRINYRNPTQHPELFYDIESAQDLFGVCIDVIGKMAAELEESSAQPVGSH